MTLVFKSTTFF